MTQTELDPEAVAQETPSDRVNAWFAAFTKAVSVGDYEAAAGLFAAECYWRDLVSFTWNITTVEGREGVLDLLQHTGAATQPSGFILDDPADSGDGVTTAWFHFETAVGARLGSRSVP